MLAGRDAVIMALPPLRLAPANSKHTPVQTGGQSVEPLSEDMWEKLEEWYSERAQGETDREERQQRSMRGKAENGELNRGRKTESGMKAEFHR